MNVRSFWVVILSLCVVGGLIAGIMTPAIAQTLTLPAASGSVRAPISPHLRPTVVATASVQARPTQMASGQTILARDTFQRPDQPRWGSASDGHLWGGAANTSPAFSIKNGAGQITGASGAQQATLDVTSADTEILLSGSVSHFNPGSGVNLGGVLRWQDAGNWYKVLINGNILQLLKAFNGNVTVLGSIPFTAVDNTSYSLRFRVVGSNLFAKAWPGAQAEPAGWMLVAVDTQLTGGISGIRVKMAQGVTMRITSFLETSVPATM